MATQDMWIRKLSRMAVATFAVSLMAACGTPKPSTIDDPRIVLQKVTERLFTTRTVHLKINLPEAGSLLGGPAGEAEGDFDISAGEVSVKGQSSEAAAAPVEVIIDSGVHFRRTDGPWANEPVAGLVAAVPSKEAIRTALMGVAGDPRLVVRLDSLATCPTGDCYPMTIEVPGDAGWDIVAGAFRALGGVPEVPPPGLPNSTIRLYADVDTFDIIQIEVIIHDQGGQIRLVVDASNHDLPIRIDPPRD